MRLTHHGVMPTYVFEDIQSKERLELPLPMSQAPGYGKTIKLEGRTLKRVVESSANIIKPFKSYVTRAVPKNTPGFQHNAKGHCIVQSSQQEKWYANRTGLEWE